METNIVITGGRAYVTMPAIAAAMRALGFPFAVLSVMGVLPDWLYDLIARNQYRFGRQVCPIPPAAPEGRLIE